MTYRSLLLSPATRSRCVSLRFTPPCIAVLDSLAFLAGVVLPLHPAFCIGTLGVLIVALWKISVCAVQP